jgi:hypothetical protein
MTQGPDFKPWSANKQTNKKSEISQGMSNSKTHSVLSRVVLVLRK